MSAKADYLDLNEDLYWLQPEMPAEEHSGWPRCNAASKEELDRIIASAKRVVVELPPHSSRLGVRMS